MNKLYSGINSIVSGTDIEDVGNICESHWRPMEIEMRFECTVVKTEDFT